MCRAGQGVSDASDAADGEAYFREFHQEPSRAFLQRLDLDCLIRQKFRWVNRSKLTLQVRATLTLDPAQCWL